MKKQILISIAALIGSGTYLSLNAQDIDDCGSTGRRVFDGARSSSSPREDRPSIKPDRGTSDQPRFTGAGAGSVQIPTPSTPQRPPETTSGSNTKTNTVNKLRSAGVATAGIGVATAMIGAISVTRPLVLTGVAVYGLGLVLLGLSCIYDNRKADGYTILGATTSLGLAVATFALGAPLIVGLVGMGIFSAVVLAAVLAAMFQHEKV